MGWRDAPEVESPLAVAKAPAWASAPEVEPPAGPGIGEALARGAGQGATLGFGDELAAGAGALMQKALPESMGGIDYGKPLGDLYRENRDAFRRENAAAQTAHPLAYGAGQVAGSLPLSIAAGGPKPAAARTLLTSAGLGALTGAGDSTAESLGGVAKDAATGGAVAGAFTGGLLGLGRALPLASKAFDKLSLKMGRKVLSNVGNSLSAKAPLADEAVREAEASGAIKFFGTSEGAAQRLEALRESVGDQYGKIVSTLEARGITGPDAQALAQGYAAEAAAVGQSSMNPAVPKVFESAAEQVAGKSAPGGRLPLSNTENLKRSLQGMARSAYQQMQPGELAHAHEAAASMMREAAEREIEQQAAASADPMTQLIASQFVPVKQRLGNLIAASNVAREGMARAARRSPFSLLDTTMASGGLAHSGPIGAVAAGVGSHLLRSRGPSTAAVAARGLSDALDYFIQPALTPVQARAQALIDALRRTALPAASEEASRLTE